MSLLAPQVHSLQFNSDQTIDCKIKSDKSLACEVQRNIYQKSVNLSETFCSIDDEFLPEEKKFACQYCLEEFTEATNKNRHIRNKHRNSAHRFQCLLCFKLLATADSFKSHSKVKHGGNTSKRKILISE